MIVSVEFPLFVIVRAAWAVVATGTFPKLRFPLKPMIRVGVGGVVGVGEGVADESLLEHDHTVVARPRARATEMINRRMECSLVDKLQS